MYNENPIITYLNSLNFPDGSKSPNKDFYDFEKWWGNENKYLSISCRTKVKGKEFCVVNLGVKYNKDKCLVLNKNKNIIINYNPEPSSSVYNENTNSLGKWCNISGMFMGKKLLYTKFDILIKELKLIFDKL
jgi:hypothetical protein